MTEWRKSFCLNVFARGFRQGRRTKRMTEIVPTDYGYQGWNPNNAHEPGRLPNSGCFTWVGIVAVRKAAMDYLAHPAVFQVQVRTNQSRKVYLWNKQPDGSITGYAPDNDY